MASLGPYPDKVLADGATLYLRLDEPSGNVVSEVGGYTGTVSGGVTRGQAGALSDGNTAMAFDGTTGQIVIPSLSIPLTCTVEAWVKGNDAGQRPVLAISGEAPAVGLLNKRLNVYDGPNNASYGGASTTVLSDGGWHHAVYVFTASALSFYVDGVFTNTIPGTRTIIGSGQAGIGRNLDFPPGNPNGFWLGSLDEVAIYPSALTPQQIATHYSLRTATLMPAWHDLRYRYCRFVRSPRWRQMRA